MGRRLKRGFCKLVGERAGWPDTNPVRSSWALGRSLDTERPRPGHRHSETNGCRESVTAVIWPIRLNFYGFFLVSVLAADRHVPFHMRLQSGTPFDRYAHAANATATRTKLAHVATTGAVHRRRVNIPVRVVNNAHHCPVSFLLGRLWRRASQQRAGGHRRGSPAAATETGMGGQAVQHVKRSPGSKRIPPKMMHRGFQGSP